MKLIFTALSWEHAPEGSKLIEAANGNDLVAKCGIAFAPKAPITQIKISTRRVKVFITDVNGYKFILDVMEKVDD
ncbi:MAG: hypothetical protein IKU36_01850 [Bacteroidales bacterium]|nr:hypothetical protein [Bacteroidales bacterium]